MTKLVYARNEDLARVWATQAQNHARSGSTTSFLGTAFYSYGACVALLAHGVGGKLYAIVSEGGFSNSTAVHIGHARRAAEDAGLTVFIVGRIASAVHSRNFDRYDERIGVALANVERAVKPEGHRASARRLVEEATAYAKAFGWEWTYDGPEIDGVLSRREREGAPS